MASSGIPYKVWCTTCGWSKKVTGYEGSAAGAGGAHRREEGREHTVKYRCLDSTYDTAVHHVVI